MTRHASGKFEVTLAQAPLANIEDASLGRMLITKQFYGDLDATSKGEMLSAGTSTEGSAAYVAIEKISGILYGRNGTFVVQHNATMTRGAPHLNITIVPDSGTDQLVGLTGEMTITMNDDKHGYDLTYTLPEAE